MRSDAMINFVKQPGVKNEPALIDNAVVYSEHPRNALNVDGIVPSTPSLFTRLRLFPS